MSDDLVQRLRADVFYGDARLANMDKHNPLHMDAADCIEAQAAEIERLQRSADSWEADALRYAQNAEYWKAELMEARWLEIRSKNDALKIAREAAIEECAAVADRTWGGDDIADSIRELKKGANPPMPYSEAVSYVMQHGKFTEQSK